MSSLLLALTLMAWPPARGATPAELADAGSWPAEPEWSEAWPLYSFTPPGWSLTAEEADGGVGMAVDRAWSVTRGDPAVVLAVIAAEHELSDPVLARAWRLNAGELPDAGDVNGNGRLDVDDFAADSRVTDRNGNGALDLEDVVTSLADGVDQDGNGRADDLCGWNFATHQHLVSADAGTATWRHLGAPVDDGRPGIGVCPACTLLPIGADDRHLGDAIAFAADAGVKAVLLPSTDREWVSTLDAASERVLFVSPGADAHVPPLVLHPGVITPRTLTATSQKDTARSRQGCGGQRLPGQVSVPATDCAAQAAARLVGVAGLVWSVNPALTPAQVVGLLGGPRVDAFHAVTSAEGAVEPALPRRAPLLPSAIARPTSEASTCAIASGDEPLQPTSCQLPSPLEAFLLRFTEQRGSLSWTTPLYGTRSSGRRLSVQALGPGSTAPLYVDLDGLFSETVLSISSDGYVAAEPRSVDTFAPVALEPGSFVVGDLDGDRALDIVAASPWQLDRYSFGEPRPGFPELLSAPLAGPPLLVQTLGGNALVTVEVTGHLVFRLDGLRWTFELPAPQASGPAGGRIDGDDFADLAIANGAELRVLLLDASGPTSSSWSKPTRATQALLGNLVGDAELEVVADAVYDARGERLLVLDGWRPPAAPPALARLGRSRHRSLVQVERTSSGFELVRYDVESALRVGDQVVAARSLFPIASTPARGGLAVADVDGDGAPDVLVPLEKGELLLISGEGLALEGSPLFTFGSVFSAPAVGVADDQLQYAVRTTRGDLVRWLARGFPEDISWESGGHDRGNTWNAETPLPERRLSGLGIVDPPILAPEGCQCTHAPVLSALALLFLFRRRRHTC